MNERIKELAAKSNFGHMENGEVVYDHRLEKFAELIVKETLQVARAGIEFGPSMEEAVYTYFGIKE
jgi:hypothetical protein